MKSEIVISNGVAEGGVMKDIFEMRLQENSEELLEGFAADFPYVSSRALLDQYTVFWHWHRAVELFYVACGSLEYHTPMGRTAFPAGSGGLVNTGVLHTTRPQGGAGPTVQKLHLFDASLLAGQTEGRIYQKYFAPILAAPQIELLPLYPHNPAHRHTLDKLKASFRLPQDAPGYEIRLREALTAIWLDFLELTPPGREQGGRSSENIKRMMLYVHEHYSENIQVSDIAAAGYVSERECYRAFQSFLHTSPGEYVKGYRLRAACRMLIDGSGTITQISQSCGFGSASFFGKTFRAGLGMTPSAYRRKWQDTAK